MTQQILKLMQQDPERGLSLILDRYGGLMNAIALNILKNPQDAEDCISEVLMRFWKHHQSLLAEEALRGYLCSTTRNAAIDMLRKKQKRMEQSLEAELQEYMALPDTALEHLSSEYIMKQIESLGEPTGTILLRRYWYCESVKEIAAALHMSPSAVQSRLFRGRNQLKEKLIQGGIVHEDQ